jgi:hypothetical protein
MYSCVPCTLRCCRPPKGEYDVDLLLGLAKLEDADSLEEASVLLSNREKLAILGNRIGFERLCQLMVICQAQEA